ncbi:hypothetical protein KXP69_002296 [Staphylococcus pseudintermedius]|nr:hypothetical protein [Staphylococcus pseudintermedius]MDE9937909.1 hypothetical protein [Staphylococcus pseudintermedius]
MDSDFTDHLIFNLYQFELIGVNTRYDENNPADIQIYKGDQYDELENITSYDALKMLDSIKYQASDMKSQVLWRQVLHVHQKLVDGIVMIKNIPIDYKDTVLYADSKWW